MKPVKHSAAAAIAPATGPEASSEAGWAPRSAPAAVLLVQRPEDDAELPGLWGLPAASLRAGEDWEEVVRRIGREKLGVVLEPGAELREGTQERSDYLLHMKLFAARIVEGVPSVPQAYPGVTQYAGWRWGRPRDLVPAARRGSLCSQLYLREVGRGWTG